VYSTQLVAFLVVKTQDHYFTEETIDSRPDELEVSLTMEYLTFHSTLECNDHRDHDFKPLSPFSSEVFG